MRNARRLNDPPEEPNLGEAAMMAPVAYVREAPRRTGPLQGFTDPSLKTVGGGKPRGFRTLMRNRYFLRLWLAQLISQTIMNAANRWKAFAVTGADDRQRAVALVAHRSLYVLSQRNHRGPARHR